MRSAIPGMDAGALTGCPRQSAPSPALRPWDEHLSPSTPPHDGGGATRAPPPEHRQPLTGKRVVDFLVRLFQRILHALLAEQDPLQGGVHGVIDLAGMDPPTEWLGVRVPAEDRRRRRMGREEGVVL